MRTFFVILLTLLLLAGAGAGYWGYKTYRGLEAQLATCNTVQASQRAELGIRSAELERVRGENATQARALSSLEQTKSETAALVKQMEAFKALTGKLQKVIDTGKLAVVYRDGRMILKLPAEVLFSSGQAHLSPAGQGTLGEVAAVLKQFPDRSFMVAGHTDAEPVKDSPFRNNWHLSSARALTVTEYFIEQGVRPNNLVAAGYGQFDPIASNKSARGRQDNRRIELVLLPNVTEIPRLIEQTKNLTASTAAPGEQPAP